MAEGHDSPEWAESDEFELQPDYDPSSSWWSVSLLFPRPSRLSDEEMQLHFRDRDGRWGAQTKAAILKHGASGLDLNDNWALAEPRWRCPSCGRAKSEIFRLSKRGVLLAKLELHHDHMRDEVWPRAEQIFGMNWRETAVPGATDVLDPIEDLVSRFHEALICSECNAADGKVKTRFRTEIDPRFTFTAQEIGRFVKGRPHAEHEIDYDVAFSIWREQERGHLARVQLLDSLLAKLGDGLLASERTGRFGVRPMWMSMDSDELLRKGFMGEVRDDERWGLLSGYRLEFLARSTCRDSASLPTARARGTSSGPSDEEFAAYEDPVSKKRWHATPQDWSCPGCGRRKRDLLRRSGKGRWTGGIREHHEYLDETDPERISVRKRLFPGFANQTWICGYETAHMCSDCSGISRATRQRNRSIEAEYLKLSDIRECISRLGPNQAHEINYQEAEKRLLRNEPYGSAYEAWRRYESLMGKVRIKMESWPRAEGLADLAEDLRVYHRIETAHERERLSSWLADEASRTR
jgi:rubredoxin